MDLEKLHEAVTKKSEGWTTNSERVQVTKERFLDQAERLNRLAEANYKGPLSNPGINIAHLDDSDLGPGRLSAVVLKMVTPKKHHHDATQDTILRIAYFFTPSTDFDWRRGITTGVPIEVTREVFTDIQGEDGNRWPIRPEQGVSLAQLSWAERFIEPQIAAMDSTATMLETALTTPGLDNEHALERYQALLGSSV